MNDILVHIKFFGAFRKFGEGIELLVPTGSTVSSIKATLQEKLENEGLVQDSVLADQNAILRDRDVLNDNVDLSILPPVCGG